MRAQFFLRENMYRNKAGFTLIELLVVVAIIGILAVAAITTYTGVQLKAGPLRGIYKPGDDQDARGTGLC